MITYVCFFFMKSRNLKKANFTVSGGTAYSTGDAISMILIQNHTTDLK